MARLGLSSPWVEYYHQLTAFFQEDEGIRVIFDEANYEIKILCAYRDVALALQHVIPIEKEFGNVKLKVTVIPPNDTVRDLSVLETKADYLRLALCRNNALNYSKEISGVFTNKITYFVFKNEVVQYFNDSLSDVHGLCSTLYENLARVIFDDVEGVFFCTDLPED